MTTNEKKHRYINAPEHVDQYFILLEYIFSNYNMEF
jgi:hypothetical protein